MATSLRPNHCRQKWNPSVASTGLGGRRVALVGVSGAISATNSRHGTARSILSRNTRLRARRLFKSRPRSVCFIRVLCLPSLFIDIRSCPDSVHNPEIREFHRVKCQANKLEKHRRRKYRRRFGSAPCLREDRAIRAPCSGFTEMRDKGKKWQDSRYVARRGSCTIILAGIISPAMAYPRRPRCRLQVSPPFAALLRSTTISSAGSRPCTSTVTKT